eukprot:138395_1
MATKRQPQKSGFNGSDTGSVSYSQPSSPKGNPSLVSSLNSNNSIIHECINTKEIIHEHKERINTPTDILKIANNTKPKRKQKKNASTKLISTEQILKLKTTIDVKHKKKRNNKDGSNVTSIQYVMNKSIQLWSVNDVIQWVKYIDNGKYRKYATTFKTKRIDGKKLLKMNGAILQSIIYHASARKAILSALQPLKKKAQTTSKKQIDVDSKTPKRKHTKHQREISSGMYVAGVRKRFPAESKANDHRKYNSNISEFLNEWDVSTGHDYDINFLGSNILELTDNFTMIELENKRIVYVVRTPVVKWTNNDVCIWLNSICGGR